MESDNEKKMKKEFEFVPGKFDPDQVVGDQNSVSGEIVEREVEDTGEATDINSSETRHSDSVMKEAEDVRNRLNKKLNEVRDYGADAREFPL